MSCGLSETCQSISLNYKSKIRINTEKSLVLFTSDDKGMYIFTGENPARQLENFIPKPTEDDYLVYHSSGKGSKEQGPIFYLIYKESHYIAFELEETRDGFIFVVPKQSPVPMAIKNFTNFETALDSIGGNFGKYEISVSGTRMFDGLYIEGISELYVIYL